MTSGDSTVHSPEDSVLQWPRGMAWEVLEMYLGRDTCSVQRPGLSGGGASPDW